jgi:hypothetical protein
MRPLRSLLDHEEYIEGPLADVGPMEVIDLCPVTKLVAVWISPGFLVVLQADRRNTEIGQAMQFPGLRDAIVVSVLPKEQFGKYRVPIIDDSVTVASILRFVILGKRDKAVRVLGGRLRSEVSKQLRAIVYRAISVTIVPFVCPGESSHELSI